MHKTDLHHTLEQKYKLVQLTGYIKKVSRKYNEQKYDQRKTESILRH